MKTTGSFLLAAGLLVVILLSFRHSGASGYAEDEGYVRDAMAASMADHGMYGIDGVPVPAVQESWWRWTGGKLAALTDASPTVVFRVMALIFSLLLIFLLIKVLDLQYPQLPLMCWLGGLFLAVSPPLALWTLTGASGPLAALLVLLAVVIHMSAASEGRPLPLSAAICIGLASAIRLEFISVWLALFVHALLLTLLNRRKVSFPAVLLCGLNGALVVAIVLAPLINWNLRVVSVPWPRGFDASMALDTLVGSQAAAGASSSLIAGFQASLRNAFSLASSAGIASAFSVKAFAVLGLAYWMIRSRGGSRDNYLTLALVLLLTPVFHACLTPFIGWAGAPALYAALSPVWVLAVLAGVTAIQHAVDPLFKRMLPAISDRNRRMLVLAIFVITPVLSGLVYTVDTFRNHQRLVRETAAAGDVVLQTFEDDGLNASADAVLTDQPGRFMEVWDGTVFDLTAELNPEFLYYLDGIPSDDLMEIISDVKEQGYRSVGVVVWNADYWTDQNNPLCANPVGGLEPDDGPIACIH